MLYCAKKSITHYLQGMHTQLLLLISIDKRRDDVKIIHLKRLQIGTVIF